MKSHIKSGNSGGSRIIHKQLLAQNLRALIEDVPPAELSDLLAVMHNLSSPAGREVIDEYLLERARERKEP